MGEGYRELRKQRPAAPASISIVAAALSFCLGVWAAWSSVGFFGRGLEGDVTAGIATTLMSIMLLAAFVFFVWLARSGQMLTRTRTIRLKTVSYLALPIAAVTSWGALCFLWDGLVRLNHDYLHWGEFGTYITGEGRTPWSLMLSSFLAGIVFGALGAFLFWFSFNTLFASLGTQQLQRPQGSVGSAISGDTAPPASSGDRLGELG
jgi:hypothetical protein